MAGLKEQHAEHPPGSLKDLYGELRQLAQQGHDEPYDLAIADRVETLVSRHLSALKNRLVQQEAEMLLDFVTEIADLGKRIPIGDFDDEGFLSAFGFAWGSHLDRQLRHPVGRDYFSLTRADLASRCTENAAQLALLRQQRQELTCRITEKEALLANADFKQRRELGNELALLKNQHGEVEHGIASEEMNALRTLLPSDTRYEELIANPPSLAFAPEKFHRSAIAALFFWRDGASARNAGRPVSEPDRAPEARLESVTENPPLANMPEKKSAAEYQPLFAPEEETAALGDEEEEHAETQSEAAIPKEEPGLAAEAMSEETRGNAPDAPAYSADCEEAVRRFGEAYRDKTANLGTAIENVAFHWIDRGYINVAYTTLKSAQFSHLPLPSLLSPDLFKAAYFGMNVWSRDDEALATSQRLLNVLSLPLIDELSGRHPGGPAVPYLLFAASFQPALFGGGFTQAPALVEYASHFLGDNFRRRLGEILGLCGNDGALSLEVLRKLPTGDQKSTRTQLAARLTDWRDRVLNKQNGWGPVRAALSNCLARNDFDRVIKAIEIPDSNDVAGVAEFVARYRDRNAIGALMEAQVATILSASESRPAEERNAKSWFVLNVLDLCGIANDWLAEHRLRQGSADDTGGLVGRVIGPLVAMREEIERTLHPGLPFEQKVGANLAAQCLSKLRLAIEDSKSSVVWSAKQTNAWLSLPYDMMEAVGFSGDAEGELVWLVDRLCSVPPAGE